MKQPTTHPWSAIAASLLLALAGCAQQRDADAAALFSDPIAPLPGAAPPSSVELAIDSEGSALYGLLYQASGDGPHPTVVLLHGLPGHERNLDIAQALRRVGWNVLFFHYRGAWGSEGRYRFAHVVADARAVVGFLLESADKLRVDPARISLVGHSVGGFAALQAADESGVRCVAALAAADLARYSTTGQTERIASYVATLGMLEEFSPEDARAELDAMTAEETLAQVINRLERTVLLVTAENDYVTGVEVDRIKRASGVTLKLIANADHSFSGQRIELTRTLAGWLQSRCRAD